MTQKDGQRCRGFTLIEALLAAVVLAAAVSAITLPFTTSVINSQIEARMSVAICLAEELMEEILAHDFLDDDAECARNVGPDPGESGRGAFDNADDYHGYSEAAGAVVDLMGQTEDIPAVHGLTRQATVEYVYVAGQDTALPPTFVRATVEVLYDGQPVVALSRLIYDTPEG